MKGMQNHDQLRNKYGLQLICASEKGDIYTVRSLMAADINSPDKDGVTPLAHAKNNNFTDMIEILENSELNNL